MSAIFSSSNELAQIQNILSKYIRLPISTETIPGAFMEAVLAHVRDGIVLNTYDFIDVHQPAQKVGWQIKSTKSTTPVTWKRAKIPNQRALIDASIESADGLQNLGNAIINFCNEHAHQSMSQYGLDEIGYARLILYPNGRVTYFERVLCTSASPDIFNPDEFSWRWSVRKQSAKKEQLEALHGTHLPTGRKWWAWHGHGENQLHFSGESCWWPESGDGHAISFQFPTAAERISLERLMELLEDL